MKGFFNNLINRYGFPKVAITIFIIVIFITAILQGQNIPVMISDSLVRIAMNGILVLAMLPGIVSGTGPNFGLSIGILGGLLATVLAIELNLSGMTAVFAAIIISIPICGLFGYVYAQLINRVKGDEMTVGTYMGFSLVSLMSIAWLILPFTNREMIWVLGGKGLRTTIDVSARFGKVMNEFLSIRIGDLFIPTGTLLFFGLCCVLMWLFLSTKKGIAITAAGDNPVFASASGIDVNRQRTIGMVLSMILGGVGIIVYSQSYAFVQLYQSPLMMPFAAVAAILIGGATDKTATISNVLSGVILFQILLTTSLPVINKLLPVGNIAEVIRIIVSNGIILYALTKSGGKEG
jgi:simple sugar transport system permease protein